MMYAALGVIGLVVIVLMVTHGSGQVAGFESDAFARMAYLVGLLALIGAGFWRTFRARMSENLRALLVWLLIGGVVVAGYAYKDRAREFGGTMLGALRPGTAVTGPGGEVTITRRSDGAFSVLAEVNGQAEQRFIFDTGASAVVLTAENAAKLGIRPAQAEFNARVSTANGTTLAAPVLLDSIGVGPITERRVRAMVSRPGDLTTNLLGTSFLDRLPSYEVRGDRLVMRSR